MSAVAPAVGALLMLVDVAIPVALLAATLPLRKGGLAARSAAALTAFLALLAFLAGRWGNDGINAAAYLLTFSLTLAIMALDVWLVCMATPWSALFCASAGYTAQNLGSSLAMLCNSVMGELGMGPVDRLQEKLIMLVVFILYQRLFVSRVHRERLEAVGDRYMLVGFFFCMLAVIGFDIAIKISVSEGVSAQTHVLLRVVHLALCGFLLLFEYRSLFETKLAVEAAIDRKIIEERSRQYEEGRKSIEALNKRMHDLVHGATRAAEQMGALDNPQVNELLEQIMGEVAHYDAIIRTGNESVDAVLTEKSLVCEREGMSLSPIADGSCLSFLRPSEVYLLLGGIVDAACEEVRGVGSPSRRDIALTVVRRADMACVSVENYVAGPAAEGGYHLSRQAMAVINEREGTLATSVVDGMRRVTVTLPLP